MERKLLCVDFEFWCELEKCLEKGENAGELHTLRGVLNKGHPIQIRIFRSKSSLGHFVSFVDNLENEIFCLYYFALIVRKIAFFPIFCPLVDFFLHIFDSSFRWGGPIFIWTAPKKTEILRRYPKTP